MSDTNPKCQQGVEPTAIEARLYRALVGYLRECEGGPELLREFEALEPLRQDELRDDNAALKARCAELEQTQKAASALVSKLDALAQEHFDRERAEFASDWGAVAFFANELRRALLSPRDGEAK